jgi:hypothetical protein
MKTNHISLPHLLWRLILVLSLVLPAALAIDVEPVQAGGGGPLPFIGLITSWIKRNKTYRTANSFIKEKAEYYDALHATASRQLLDNELLNKDLHPTRMAALTKVVALIEQERGWMNEFAESEKKAARTEFIDAVQDEITNRMLASTPATELLGAMGKGITSSQGFLDSALEKLGGGGGGFLEDIAKVKRIADRMTIAGGMIGGNFGKAIQKAGSNISDFINKPTAEIEAGLIQVQEELGDLGDLVSGLQDQGYRPTASQTTRDVVISLITGEESDNPAINQIVDMVIAKHNQGGDFRDRAKAILLGNLSARCAARIEQMRRVVFKLQMEPAEYEEDESSEIPSCAVIDMTALVEEAADLSPTAESPTAEAEDAATSELEATSPPAEPVWVLVDTVENPNQAKTSFRGGGPDPDYFTEARFEGKSLTFNCSAGSFSYTDVDVDREYTYHNITLTASFDQPPSRLVPGEEIDLQASASHSGSVNEGSAGGGLIFQYNLGDRTLDPVLSYYPWAQNFDGTSTGSWTFKVPAASEGGEFTIAAGLWNSPPCYVIWTYQVQQGE